MDNFEALSGKVGELKTIKISGIGKNFQDPIEIGIGDEDTDIIGFHSIQSIGLVVIKEEGCYFLPDIIFYPVNRTKKDEQNNGIS